MGGSVEMENENNSSRYFNASGWVNESAWDGKGATEFLEGYDS